MNENYSKRALAYSFLAHVRNSGTLVQGPLEIFVPLVKKGLHFMNVSKEQYKGESIDEIRGIVYEKYNIDIPIPVLRTVLRYIANEVNQKEHVFDLYNDDSFWIKDYVFEDYDIYLNRKEKEIESLQNLFTAFCKANGLPTQNTNVIKFIEKNKASLSYYITHKEESNGENYTIEAKFVEHFRAIPDIYEQIKDIYLGTIICSLLDYTPTNLKVDVDLLLDTNFVVSLLDLNTPESTHTCRKLIEVSKSLGFSLHVLADTVDEIKGLLTFKAENFDKSIIQKYVNKEDIYNACSRLKFSKADLERVRDNVDNSLSNYGVFIIPHTEKLRNIAKYGSDYAQLKNYRSNHKAALHDAMCLAYVREKRKGKTYKNFEDVNCWFVNNAISHDFENEGIERVLSTNDITFLPEIIKVDDLLNILWLSNPSMGVLNDTDMVDIGLTSLVAFTLNKSLPKARIIKELDDNIQKYRDENISERDVFLLSTRIANGQIRNLEKLNELATSDTTAFNKAVKEEANKQSQIELERGKKLDEVIRKFEESIEGLKEHKIRIDEKNEKLRTEYERQLSQRDEEMKERLASKTKEEKVKEQSHKYEINEITKQFELTRKEDRLRQIDKDIYALEQRKENAEKQAHCNLVNYKFKFFSPAVFILCFWCWFTHKFWSEESVQWLIYIIPIVTGILYWAYTGFFCENPFKVFEFFKRKESDLKAKQYLLYQYSEDEYQSLSKERQDLAKELELPGMR